MSRIFTIAALFFLPGCYSIGSPRIANPDIVSLIVPGESTKQDVEELVGKPTKVDFDDEEREKWFYEYTLSRVSGRQLIPLFGMFAGPDVEKHSLTILFDDAGLVSKVAGGAAQSLDTLQGAGQASQVPQERTKKSRRGKRLGGAAS